MAEYLDMGMRFRELIARPQGLFGFGVAKASDAARAEEAGAECVYAGGYSMALAQMMPDTGQMNMVEVLQQAKAIAKTVSIPVIVDIDDGYGNASNVLRTASEFFGQEFLNVTTSPWTVRRIAGIHIEDQPFPKRCGHMAGKEVIPVEVMIGKVKAASDVRDALYRNAIIIARTDSYNSNISGSLDEAVMRLLKCADAGANLVWCEMNTAERAPIIELAEKISKRNPYLPMAFNYSPNLKWHKVKNPMTFEELNGLGYKFIFITIAAEHAASMAVFDYMRALKEMGAEALWGLQKTKVGHPTENAHKMARVDKWQELEKKYIPGAEERINSSDGGFGAKDNK